MNTREENEINLSFLLQALLRHIWVIILSLVIGAAGMFVYSRYIVKPMYTSTAQMYVNNLADGYTQGDYISTTEIDAAKELVNTYITILYTPDTLDSVIERTGLNYSVGQLSSMISAGSVDNTEVFYVSVTAKTPEEAEILANKITEVLPSRISGIIKGSDVRLVQGARTPGAPSSPNIGRNTLLGAIIGVFLSALVIVIVKLVDNTIHDDNYASDTYGLRTLASIPDINEVSDEGYSYSSDKAIKPKRRFGRKLDFSHTSNKVILCDKLPFRVSEAYKMLRTNIFKISEKHSGCTIVGISSANPGDGKSTLSVNLAYTLAQANKRVLLIEADLRKPVFAKRLPISPAVGLSDMLAGNKDGAIQPSGYFDNWHIICAGRSESNPSELLGSHAMEVLISELRSEYDHIIIDLPPINEVTDAIAVSGCLTGMLLTIRQNVTSKTDLETAMRHLSFSGTELLGFVITGSLVDSKTKYGKYKYKTYTVAEETPTE